MCPTTHTRSPRIQPFKFFHLQGTAVTVDASRIAVREANTPTVRVMLINLTRLVMWLPKSLLSTLREERNCLFPQLFLDVLTDPKQLLITQGHRASWGLRRNIAIDSGATLTALPTIFYCQLKAVIKQAIKIRPLVDDNSTTLCYKDLEAVDVPPVTVHFITQPIYRYR
ncbi:hypothetical protein HAX54_017932 [Datura stramonium]|uniref:Peptidase A2 domain-containing protein n=1 Tax=Datura stramonium TaxID=4076 RepID=A0ABS8S1M0_DATST|nr:hypothetical protein [Datura stramonium]